MRKPRFSAAFFGLPEAKDEAAKDDSTLRSVVQAWSTLDQLIREAIALLARQGKNNG